MSLAYTLTPYQPFSGAVQALIATSDPSLYTAASSQQYMGHSYDPVSGLLFFSSSVLIDSVATGSAFDKINNTGHTFYDVSAATSVAPNAHYDGSYLKNFYLHYLDTSTGAVTMIDVFDPTATIPNGIVGSDGTWRMVVASDVSTPNVPMQFKLVDPRTIDCFAHMTEPQCNIYVFRQGEGYKQRLLPFGADGHMEMLGITANWLLVMHSTSTDRLNGELFTVPRLTTTDETTNGQLLGYFVETQDSWMDGAYWRSALTPDAALYIFGNQRAGTRDYRLFRYDPPASIGSWMGSAQPGGTFTDITPWSGSTGPNSDCAAWIFDHANGAFNTDRILRWKQNIPLSLPATNQLAWLSILCPQAADSGGTSHAPANFRVDCTYYDIGGATFDYHKGFIGGYMTAAWEVTAVPADAAFAPQFVREIDTFRELQGYDYGDDYTVRAFEFSCQAVTGGTFTWASGPNVNFAVIVTYGFAYGAPPVVLDVRVDSSWLPFYGTYAAAIANNNVVEQSILMDGGTHNDEFAGSEIFIADTGFKTAKGIWFGGWNGAGAHRQSININPAFPQYRGTWADFDPYPLPAAIVRLSWAEVVPGKGHFYRRTYFQDFPAIPPVVPPTTAPINIGAPAMNQAFVGVPSVCSSGVWSGTQPITFTYQRYVDGVLVATTSTYTPVMADDGKPMYGIVTAHNVAGSASAQSNTLTVTTTSDLPLADDAALYAMLTAGTVASGNKSYLLAPGQYGVDWFINYDFSSAPIIIKGQTGVFFTFMGFAGTTSGITWQDIEVNGNGDGDSEATIELSGGTNQVLTFNRVKTVSSDSMGTQTGGGWYIRGLTGSTIAINGSDDWTDPDIWGRTYGMAFTDCDPTGTILVNGMRLQNIGINAIEGGGGQNITFRRIGIQDQFWGPGDHPNGFHFFNDGPVLSQNILIEDSGVAQGEFGLGTQCYVWESDRNVTMRASWGYDAVFPYTCANARGDTFLLDRCFFQGIEGGAGGGTQITRGGAANTTVQFCTLNGLNNFSGDGVNPGYDAHDNDIIGLASHYGDWSAQEVWAAANPTAIPHPA